MTAPVEERLAYLEGRVEEQALMVNGIRETVASLEQRMDWRFEAVELRLTNLEDKMERRFEAVTLRIDGLDSKLSNYFVWTVGIQVTTFVAIVAAVLAR